MEIKNKEIWKDIPSYEGLYQVSNLGEIKALLKIRKTGKKGATIRTYPEKILKPSNFSKSKYFTVTLCKNGKRKYFTLHKLIALTFLNKKDTDQCVNHIDCNRFNNAVSNLEWCTFSDNSKQSFFMKRQNNYFEKGSLNISSKKVLNISDNIIYDSIKEAYKNYKCNFHIKTFTKKLKNQTLNNLKLI